MSYFSVTSKIRTPIKGLRQKLRNAVRTAGITEKFSTEVLRDGRIAVISEKNIVIPFQEFEGRKVVFVKKAI